MFVGADAHIGPLGKNSPQISVKTVRTARADVDIDPYKPVSNIRTKSYRESHSFAPE